MKYLQLIILLLLLTLLFCTPEVTASFFIENRTHHTIKARYYLGGIFNDNIGLDSSIIHSDSIVCINYFSGIGQASTVRDNFSVYIDSITIWIKDSLVYQQIPADKSKWIADENINDWSGGGSAYYTLIIDSLVIR